MFLRVRYIFKNSSATDIAHLYDCKGTNKNTDCGEKLTQSVDFYSE